MGPVLEAKALSCEQVTAPPRVSVLLHALRVHDGDHEVSIHRVRGDIEKPHSLQGRLMVVIDLLYQSFELIEVEVLEAISDEEDVLELFGVVELVSTVAPDEGLVDTLEVDPVVDPAGPIEHVLVHSLGIIDREDEEMPAPRSPIEEAEELFLLGGRAVGLLKFIDEDQRWSIESSYDFPELPRAVAILHEEGRYALLSSLPSYELSEKALASALLSREEHSHVPILPGEGAENPLSPAGMIAVDRREISERLAVLEMVAPIIAVKDVDGCREAFAEHCASGRGPEDSAGLQEMGHGRAF